MSAGSVKFPVQAQPIDITGEWVDYSSLIAGTSINENFYNRQTGTWFEGADNPWTMNPETAFGLKVNASGSYVWIIAVQHSVTECVAYSAEHFTGHVTADGQYLNFVEESWRSKYVNSCAPEENKDFDVQPGQMQLSYEVSKEYDLFLGKEYVVMTITAGGDAFKLYKR